jgi:hypothetical protein
VSITKKHADKEFMWRWVISIGDCLQMWSVAPYMLIRTLIFGATDHFWLFGPSVMDPPRAPVRDNPDYYPVFDVCVRLAADMRPNANLFL